MFDVGPIVVRRINSSRARVLVKAHHYMGTWPAGSRLSYGVFYGDENLCLGVAVFGRSTGTAAKAKLFTGVVPDEIIEMQRLWVSDKLGHNSESKILSLIMADIKANSACKVVWTYAGGCKNDCGIVYQSSGFMYLGCEPCNDFYLTDGGRYQNLVSVKRFGKGPKGEKDDQKIGEFMWGPGKLLKTTRYFYFYPLDRKVRRLMKQQCKPYPKDSAQFRKDQAWV